MMGNLRATIQQIYRDTGEADPANLAKLVLDNITMDDIREDLFLLVRGYARTVIVGTRGHDPGPPIPTKGGKRGGKWDQIHQAILHRRFVSDSYFFEDGYKLFGYAAIPDLEWLSSDHQERSAALLAKKQCIDALIAKMEEYGARIVADLPQEVIEEVMS